MAVQATMREAPKYGAPTGAPVDADTPRSTPPVELLGYRIDRLDLEATAQRCRDAIVRKERVHHVSLAAAKAVNARADRRLAEILEEAELVSADGQSLVWASRLLGKPLPERVPGIDLMLRLLEIAETEGFRVFFLGARHDVLARALTNLRARYPRLIIAGSHHGYFDADSCADVCAEINQGRPQILFVAMSSPRKEYWVSDYGSMLDAQVIVGVGGSLDVIAGVVRRAPRWVQRAGFEWAFRLLQEPGRLWRRYLFTNARFIGIVATALCRRALERRAIPWRPL
jgi:N-acetylglucosaminyldiphosphoundecaprenol N-acetyl-beta-D-mannosaminyltransferase